MDTLITNLPKTQAQRVLDYIIGAGATGTNHDSMRIACDAPLASVRRITQQLRASGQIRVSHYVGSDVIFVAASVPVL